MKYVGDGVPSTSIRKQGESASSLQEQGKGGTTTSLSLQEKPDCTCINMEFINLIKQFIGTVFQLSEIIVVHKSTFLELLN